MTKHKKPERTFAYTWKFRNGTLAPYAAPLVVLRRAGRPSGATTVRVEFLQVDYRGKSVIPDNK